jgi:hypothetical protein
LLVLFSPAKPFIDFFLVYSSQAQEINHDLT